MDSNKWRRRRRRRLDRLPISASLLLDDRLKEDVGLISEDLYAEIFATGKLKVSASRDVVHHIAISPWVPTSQASISDSSWTIIPVLVSEVSESQSKAAHASIRLPTTSLALQSFYKTLQVVSPGKALLRKDTPIDIRVIDVVPVGLEIVYVTLYADALLKLHESHVRFGGGFVSDSGRSSPLRHKALNGVTGQVKPNIRLDEKALEASWRYAVKNALRNPQIIHAGDQISLPLLAHPVTHAPPPPAKITSCEPVSQGILTPATKVVIIKAHDRQKAPKQTGPPIANGIPEEDEDTSNEQFYSAAEERGNGLMSSAQEEEPTTTDFSDAQSVFTDQDDLSDDPEEIFSLSTPMLPPQTSGILSSYNAATPRPGGLFSTNIGTPGSVHSSFSASTVRGGGSNKGKTFKLQGLLQKIPDDLLHPKPTSDDDDEARVFVETSVLVKIGCFSGDWVRIESAPEPHSDAISLVPWASSFQDEPEEPPNWRPVKIYGLPEMKKTNRVVTHKPGARKALAHFDRRGPTPTAYLSPVLLANLSNPSHLRISPLSTPSQGQARPSSSSHKINSSSMPPLASEVKILKILSPLSHDLQLQPVLYAELKDYFEGRKRLLKTGDLVAISFDETLGRSMYQAGSGDTSYDDLLFKSKRNRTRSNSVTQEQGRASVAWFKVTSVDPEGTHEKVEESAWGGVAFVDVSSSSSSTKLMQNGNETSRLPPALDSSWQFYQGTRRLPAATTTRLAATLSISEAQVSSMRRRLRGLISAATSPQAIHMGLPPLAILLTSTQRQIGKAYTAEKACEDLGLHCCSIDAYDATTNNTAGTSETEEFVKQRAQRALTCGSENTVLLFKHMDALTGDKMQAVFKGILAESRVIVATSTDVDKIPEGIRALFTNELEIGAPDEGERETILRDIVEGQGIRLASDVELSSIALKTAALVAGDLLDVVNRANAAKKTRLQKVIDSNDPARSDVDVTTRDLEVAGGSWATCLTKADFEAAVDAARKNFADAIGAPKIPNVGWDDVGGMAHIKEAVMETIQLPLARPELFAKGMKKRSGILFYGPPGTGKTLLAKAIATEFSLNFFSVKGPELLNMYIGESEANVRRVFQRARDARPCVVFFDELDSVAPKRGNQGDSGGVMDRIVSQLLAELDGMSNGEEGGGGVFVIGATNRPDLLDQALLRPGRFDKMLYLGISDTHEKQLKIMEALTRKFTLHPSCSLQRVSTTLPFTFTGADLYALCSDAMLKAITRAARKVDGKVAHRNSTLRPGQNPLTIAQFFDHYATDDDTSVLVMEDDFHAAHKELVPSVSAEEFGHYERVRKAFEGDDAQTQKPNTHSKQGSLTLNPRPDSQASNKSNVYSLKSPTVSSPSFKPRPNSSNSQRSQSPLLQKRNDRSTFYFDNNEQPELEDEDEYIVRTDHLVGNHNGIGHAGHPPHVGHAGSNGYDATRYVMKGKGKGNAPTFGSATHGDEDLYQ